MPILCEAELSPTLLTPGAAMVVSVIVGLITVLGAILRMKSGFNKWVKEYFESKEGRALLSKAHEDYDTSDKGRELHEKQHFDFHKDEGSIALHRRHSVEALNTPDGKDAVLAIVKDSPEMHAVIDKRTHIKTKSLRIGMKALSEKMDLIQTDTRGIASRIDDLFKQLLKPKSDT